MFGDEFRGQFLSLHSVSLPVLIRRHTNIRTPRKSTSFVGLGRSRHPSNETPIPARAPEEFALTFRRAVPPSPSASTSRDKLLRPTRRCVLDRASIRVR